MRSAVSGREYEDVRIRLSDWKDLTVRDAFGHTFRSLEDRTWIATGQDADTSVRYRWYAAHAGGIVLKPVYELVDGTWRCLVTGREAPPLTERRS